MHTLTQFWRWRLGDSVCSSMNEMRSSNKLQELNILKSKSYLQNNSTLQSVARRIIFWKFCGENMLTSSIYSAGISLHLLLWKLTDAVVLYKITNLNTIYAANILSRHNIWFRGHLSLVSDSCNDDHSLESSNINDSWQTKIGWELSYCIAASLHSILLFFISIHSHV